MSKSGIPSAIGVDHVAITVPDLQQALDFFVNVLGCEHAFTAGPFSDPTGTWMETNLAVDPRAATTLAIAAFRLPLLPTLLVMLPLSALLMRE